MIDPILVSLGAIVLLFVLLALGVHIGIALGVSGLVGLSFIMGVMPTLWESTITAFYTISDYKLVTVPLFIMMGLLAAGGGVAARLYECAELWVGKFKAGLGVATIFGAAGFGAVCGSSLVTASVFAKVSAPQMRAHGFDKQLAYGTCASAGMIGMLIPPSVLLVVYGIASGESIGKLLVGGMAPGILLTILFSVGLMGIGILWPDRVGTTSIVSSNVTWRRRFASILPLWPVGITALIIFGGIFGGVFNPTEAASAGTFVLMVMIVIVRGRKFLGEMAAAFTEAVTIAAMIFTILIGASIFSHLLTLSGLTVLMTNFILNLPFSTGGIVIAIVLLYIVLGCFLDSTSMVFITVPILHPTMVAMGVDPIWYSLVVVMAMEVGLITPPVGLNVYGAHAVAEKDVTVEDVFWGSAPFFILAVLALVLLIAFPAISTWLPSVMFEK